MRGLACVLGVVAGVAHPGDAGAAGGDYVWGKRFGGASDDNGWVITATPDGGVLLAGDFQNIVDFGGGPRTSAGLHDIFVVKLGVSGNHLWSRRFGGTGTDRGYGISATPDGGGLVTGHFQGTVDFGGGPRTSAGDSDIFVLRLGPSGNHLWSYRFGGTIYDAGTSICATSDGGALVTGDFRNTVDFGDGQRTSAGGVDMFVVKLGPSGNCVWSRAFGGTGTDLARCASTTPDGGALLTGDFQNTVDFGGGPRTSAGGTDIFVLKLGPGGNHMWSQRFGGTGQDVGDGISATSDGGALVTGAFQNTVDFGGGPRTSLGQHDIFALKLGPSGNYVWSHRFGGTGSDVGYSISATPDAGALVTGYFQRTVDFGGETRTSAGADDIFALKLGLSGNRVWSHRFGGMGNDRARCISATPAGGVLLTGDFRNTVDFGGGPRTSAGGSDIFVLRLGTDSSGGVLASGGVVDEFNDRGIAGAQVSLVSGQGTFSGTTSADGLFTIPCPPGTYTATVSHPAYRSLQRQVQVSLNNPNVETSKLQSRVVVLVHGLVSDRRDWEWFREELQALDDDYIIPEPPNLVPNCSDWDTGTAKISEQADLLREFIATETGGARSVDVVAHSMGGLVSRDLLKRLDSRLIRNLVMLGTPNHGTELAGASPLLLLLKGCAKSTCPEFCLGYDIDNIPWKSELDAGGAFLGLLNYDDAGAAMNNFQCRTHANEQLPSKTRYVTYAGTRQCRSSNAVRNLAEYILWTLSFCENDGAVPKKSVALLAEGPSGLLQVENWLDRDCGCTSEHFTIPDCVEMLEDPCVVQMVHRALLGQGQTCPGSGAVASRGRGGDGLPRASLLGVGEYLVGVDSPIVTPIAVSQSDSVEVQAAHRDGAAALTLVSPTGTVIDSTFATTSPDVDFTHADGLQRYVARHPTPGTWQVVVDGLPGPQAVGIWGAIEHSSLSVAVELEGRVLLPGDRQVVRAVVLLGEEPVVGLSAAATVTGPKGGVQEAVLRDDGVYPDTVAEDGEYSGLVADNDELGRRAVLVSVRSEAGQRSEIHRDAMGSYEVVASPDLEVSALKFDRPWVGPDALTLGMSATVRNLGIGTAVASRVDFVEKDTGEVFSQAWIGALPAGGSAVVQAEWPARRALPKYEFRAVAVAVEGDGDLAAENNSTSGSIGVAREALAPEEGGLEAAPTEAAEPVATVADFRLQILANPVRDFVEIEYSIPAPGRTRVDVFDVTGRRVAMLASDADGEAGQRLIRWDRRDSAGSLVAPGIYFARLEHSAGSLTRKLVVLK